MARTFLMPVTVVDNTRVPGTVIGANSFLGGNGAGVILTSNIMLYGAGGPTVGSPHIQVLGDPGLVEVGGGGQFGQICVSNDAGGRQITIAVTDTANVTVGGNGADGIVQILNSAGRANTVLNSGQIAIGDPEGCYVVVDISNAGPEDAAVFSLYDFAHNERIRLTSFGDNRIEGLTVRGNLTVEGDVFLPGADCAEHFDVVGAHALEPGTVVVIDETGALTESRCPYDKKVAGIVSGAGEHRPAITLDRQVSVEGRVPLALVGKAYCKVDADVSPIGVGDLLTTSETPGHAMRADDPTRAFGAVLGKALRALSNGRDLIPVLIALQ